MTKYRIICKACNAIQGYSDKVSPENLRAKCDACGQERIAVEPIFEDVVTDLEFDFFIVNKRTNVSKHNGFIIKRDELASLDIKAFEKIFIEKIAESLGGLLTPEGIASLVRR